MGRLGDGLEVNWSVLGEWTEAFQAIIHAGHMDVFTSYAETAAVVAQHSLMLYQGYLKGIPLPNGASVQRPSGNLARRATLAEPGYLDFRLENDAEYAEAIEKGTQERDMKKILPTAPKARRAKDGSLYLIIPFRHGTQQDSVGMRPMPETVWRAAQKLKRSSIVGTREEVSGTGHKVQRNVYNWGGSLTGKALSSLGLSYKEQNRFEGMYKFGEKGHSSYVTFRVMSEKSSGWIIPARPGLFPAKTAAEEAYRDGKDALSSALLDDLMRLSGLG
jgi:hypothetical protein